MKRSCWGFLIALFMALLLFLPGQASAHEGQDNTFLYKACAVGVTAVCPILEMDAVAGVPEAQYQMGLLILSQGGSKDSKVRAVTLIYNAAQQGHPLALKIYERAIRNANERKPYPKPAPGEPRGFSIAKLE